MNNNDSKHTPIITLEEIARRKAEKREEVLKAKTQITETLRELFVPEENKGWYRRDYATCKYRNSRL